MAHLRVTSLVERAQEELSRRIDEGEFREGDRLVIDRLAREFGTSLVPIREALARMHMQRILNFEPNKGYSVAALPSSGEVGDLLDARLALELGALELSASKIDSTEIARLQTLNDEMRDRRFAASIAGYGEFAKLNAEFHTRLVKAAANPLLTEAYENLGYHQRIARTVQGEGVQDIALLVAEHQKIIDALSRSNLTACRNALRSHILDAKQRILDRDSTEI